MMQSKIPVHRITGRAGTGKTTYLLDEIEQLMGAQVHPKNIALVTLTNAGADVFRERAINKFNFRYNDTIKSAGSLGGLLRITSSPLNTKTSF